MTGKTIVFSGESTNMQSMRGVVMDKLIDYELAQDSNGNWHIAMYSCYLVKAENNHNLIIVKPVEVDRIID